MHPLAKAGVDWPCEDKFLVYVQRFDICGEDNASQLRILKCSKRMNGQRKGDVIPLAQVRSFAHLIPWFGASADPHLTAFNSFEHSTEFYLNIYFEKDTYLSLSPR
jgi:hypothetical protein